MMPYGFRHMRTFTAPGPVVPQHPWSQRLPRKPWEKPKQVPAMKPEMPKPAAHAPESLFHVHWPNADPKEPSNGDQFLRNNQ